MDQTESDSKASRELQRHDAQDWWRWGVIFDDEALYSEQDGAVGMLLSTMMGDFTTTGLSSALHCYRTLHQIDKDATSHYSS